MENKLICGDAVEMMRTLPDASVDLLIADPPYNLGKDDGVSVDRQDWQAYEEFTVQWLTEAVARSETDRVAVCFYGRTVYLETVSAAGRTVSPAFQRVDYVALYAGDGPQSWLFAAP